MTMADNDNGFKMADNNNGFTMAGGFTAGSLVRYETLFVVISCLNIAVSMFQRLAFYAYS